jgi:hypothetical protein
LDEGIPNSAPSMEALLRTIPPWEDLPSHLVAASRTESQEDLRSASSSALIPRGQDSPPSAIASPWSVISAPSLGRLAAGGPAARPSAPPPKLADPPAPPRRTLPRWR